MALSNDCIKGVKLYECLSSCKADFRAKAVDLQRMIAQLQAISDAWALLDSTQQTDVTAWDSKLTTIIATIDA